ncbi:hypothetical protein H4K38_16285 [Streptomyces sp. I3(2020)]|nr:hypothetical protein [Streptomyces sp. I3(2020)]
MRLSIVRSAERTSFLASGSGMFLGTQASWVGGSAAAKASSTPTAVRKTAPYETSVSGSWGPGL